jgi:hypothetical protein
MQCIHVYINIHLLILLYTSVVLQSMQSNKMSKEKNIKYNKETKLFSNFSVEHIRAI